MAKNRDRTPAAKDLPGGKAGQVVASGKDVEEVEDDDGAGGIVEKVFEEDIRKSFTPEMADALLGARGAIEELKSSERNRLQRAEMHLSFLIQEITALANEGALVGQFRKACAECRVVFNDSNAALWQPLKSVDTVLKKLAVGGGGKG